MCTPDEPMLQHSLEAAHSFECCHAREMKLALIESSIDGVNMNLKDVTI